MHDTIEGLKNNVGSICILVAMILPLFVLVFKCAYVKGDGPNILGRKR